MIPLGINIATLFRGMVLLRGSIIYQFIMKKKIYILKNQ